MDAKSNDLLATATEKLSWEPNDVMTSIEALAAHVRGSGEAAAGWYMAKRRLPSIAARWIRVLAIVFVTLGGLAPVLDSTIGERAIGKVKVTGTGAGYVYLAFAAALVALDRYSGCSSTWMRRITAGQQMRRLLVQFDVDWPPLLSGVKATASKPPTPDQVKPLFERIAKLATDIEDEISEETKLWKVEFQTSFAQLEKATQSSRKDDAAAPQQQPAAAGADAQPGAATKKLAPGEQAVAGADAAFAVKKADDGGAADAGAAADAAPAAGDANDAEVKEAVG